MGEWGNGGMRNGLGKLLPPEAVSFLTPSFPHSLIPSNHWYCTYDSLGLSCSNSGGVNNASPFFVSLW